MRKTLCALIMALAAAPSVFAQVTAEIVFEQEVFLRSESLPLRIRINNFSGQPLQFANTPDWITFTVENHNGVTLRKLSDIPKPKPFTVESSKSVSLRMDLMPHFNLSEPGRYSVKAVIAIPQIEKTVLTDSESFDIISGTTIWEREVGVPGTKPAVVRKFALQKAMFIKQIRLSVRVTDASESEVIRVIPLGMLLSFSQPEAIVDNASQLHVLYQSGPKSFLYSIVTTDGDLIVRQTWDFGSMRPRLQSNDDGRVTVTGGTRRILLSDLPPPRVAETNEFRSTN
jgi:hypothetical protein